MPLDKDRLKNNLKTAIQSLIDFYTTNNFSMTPDEMLDSFCNKISTTIIDEFKENAEVTGYCPDIGGDLETGRIT